MKIVPRVLLVETCASPRPVADALSAEHRVRLALALQSVVDARPEAARGAARDARGGELAMFGIPLGAAFLAGPLRRRGCEVLHEPLILHAAAGRDVRQALREAVHRERPDVVGLTVNHALEERTALSLAHAVHETDESVRVVLGGMHATFRAEYLAARPEVDAVLRFEGEESLPLCIDWLAGRREADDVPGLTARAAYGVRSVPPAPPVDFTRAVPDYDAVRADEYVRAGILAHVQTSRGCPFECHFCCHTTFWGRRVRYRDAGLVAAEVVDLLGRGCDLIYLTDSTFTLNRERTRELCAALVDHGADRATFAVETRMDRLDDELLSWLARAGVRIVALGVESVSPDVLAHLPDKQRADPLGSVRDAVRRIRAQGMSTWVSAVLGLPGETEESLAAMVRAVELLYADTDGLLWVDAKLARAFPGSAFADDPARLHATVDQRHEFYDFYGDVTVHLDGGPRPEAIQAAKRAIMERNVRAWRVRRPEHAAGVARAMSDGRAAGDADHGA